MHQPVDGEPEVEKVRVYNAMVRIEQPCTLYLSEDGLLMCQYDTGEWFRVMSMDNMTWELRPLADTMIEKATH